MSPGWYPGSPGEGPSRGMTSSDRPRTVRIVPDPTTPKRSPGLLATAIVASVDSEVYRFPLTVTRQAVAWSWLTVMAAAVFSGLVVRQRLDRLDLVAVLKIME